MKLTQLLRALFFCLILTGADAETLSYDYFMKNPTAMQAAFKHCAEGLNIDEAQCKMISQASKDFLQLVEERSRDPEGFGRQIMDLQIALANNSQIHSEEYKKQMQQLQVMYAVIAATSME